MTEPASVVGLQRDGQQRSDWRYVAVVAVLGGANGGVDAALDEQPTGRCSAPQYPQQLLDEKPFDDTA
jgi:hypothetical protein